MNQASGNISWLWRTARFGSIEEYTSHKIVLHAVPHRRPQQAVETAKRILTKEKLDKQLTGQVSTSPFMSIREGASRRISFDTREELSDKVDKLTVMIGKLAAKDSGRTRQFKPQIHQSRGRGQNRSYSQRNYQNRYRSDEKVGIEDSSGKTEVDTDLSKVIEVVSEIIPEDTVNKIVGRV